MPWPVTLLALLLSGLGFAQHAWGQAIWFAPRPVPPEKSDYMELFRPDAPWQQAASHVAVFSAGGRFITHGSEETLQTVFGDMKRRNIPVQIGIEPLKGQGPGFCGHGVEGYGGPLGGMVKFAERLRAAGITPQFFGMDEPLYFGHVFVSQGNRIGCRSPISEVARNVANTVRQMRSVFPGVRFGDTEPLTFRPGDPWYQNNQWLVDLGEWLDAYEAEVGDKLAYLRLDLWWNMPWREHMPALSELLRRKGVPLQVIYNGDGRAKTDEAWIDSAIANFKAFESGAWPKPAAAVFQYWTPHPSRVLPEGDPLSATGLVNRYVRWQQTGR